MQVDLKRETQQLESYLEEKVTCFKVLLELTREQEKITKEEDMDLKRLDLILKQKEVQVNKIKRIDKFLNGRKGSEITNEKTTTLAQIIKDLIALEESSYQNLSSAQLPLKEELLNHHRKRGLKKLYTNRPVGIICPKFIEREI
jgi:hypothetical protein